MLRMTCFGKVVEIVECFTSLSFSKAVIFVTILLCISPTRLALHLFPTFFALCVSFLRKWRAAMPVCEQEHGTTIAITGSVQFHVNMQSLWPFPVLSLNLWLNSFFNSINLWSMHLFCSGPSELLTLCNILDWQFHKTHCFSVYYHVVL